MNRLALFDCDGTLVDSQTTICLAMQRAFDVVGVAAPGDPATRGIIGLSLPEALTVLYPGGTTEEHDAIGEAYKAAFFDMRTQGLANHPLYDGIAEAIGDLDARGWLLGVATGKSDRGLKAILEHHGLHPRFITLQTSDRHPSKPHPSMIEQAMADAGSEPATTAMIGDTSYDMAMARAAGCAAIGVAWGYHNADQLIEAGADVVAEHPSALVAILEAL
ncbi:HAD-IA family hydrolase [Sphingomonas sp.]|uniref:HAD-IA family hydrolase n=1 Tax=Sphingomonas sp. TaxID=28214 RepID=UPI003B3A56B7